MFDMFNRKKYFQKHEKEFLSYLHEKNGTKLSKDNLTFAFFDLDGNGYYKFPEGLSLPMSRLGKLQEYVTFLSAGITGSELESMMDKADKILTDGLSKGKGAAKLGFILSVIKERKGLIIHDELFYNILAVQFVRSDESPTDFNNEIQMQKVEMFRRLDKENDTFFLTIQEYLKAFNWSRISREELATLLNNSLNHRQAEEKTILCLFGK